MSTTKTNARAVILPDFPRDLGFDIVEVEDVKADDGKPHTTIDYMAGDDDLDDKARRVMTLPGHGWTDAQIVGAMVAYVAGLRAGVVRGRDKVRRDLAMAIGIDPQSLRPPVAESTR